MMDRDELLEKMRGRVTLCRNLAASTGDPETAKALRALADEGERDIQRLEAQPPDDGSSAAP